MPHSLRREFKLLALAAAVVATMLGSFAARAGAAVLDLSALGAPSGHYGVLEYPSDPSGALATAGIPKVTDSGVCQDPALSADLVAPANGLCWHGGPVVHASQIFSLTWDAGSPRSYWSGTRGFLEQFLRDVSDGSGTLSSPFAVATQYADGAGQAANQSTYGGSCIDYGIPGGSACQFGSTAGTAAGDPYPSSGCPLSAPAAVCLDDAQIQGELAQVVTQTGLSTHLRPGTTPVLVVLLPKNVESCVDSAGKLCQANNITNAAAAHFCSYHAHLQVGGTDYAYVVQPWTINTVCDEPNLPGPPTFPIWVDAGQRLVSPMSAGTIAALVDPDLNAWYAHSGAEVYDNGGCHPAGYKIDTVTVGGSSQNPYWIQPEFSNAGVMIDDPISPSCALSVVLAPNFVVPSPVNSGDVVAFDGSITSASLIAPAHGYAWDFGDGTGPAYGPSVTHSYAYGGTYSVKLTVTDRGGNAQSLTQAIKVSGPPPPAPSTGGSGGGSSTPPPPPAAPSLGARFQLLPQSLRAVINQGVGVTLSAREAADGVAYISIPAAAARRAHLKGVHGATMMVGRGALSGITATSVTRHLHLPLALRAKLRKLRKLTLTVRLVLVGADGAREAIDLAGRY